MMVPVRINSMLAAASLVMLVAQGAPAAAQQAAPAPQAYALAPNPADFALTALRIVQVVDGGDAQQIWDTASPVLKQLVSRDQFAATARLRFASHGALQNLQWRSIARATLTEQQGQLQPGEYLSVNFVGLNKDRKAVVETVSFILDADQTWRLVGLSIT